MNSLFRDKYPQRPGFETGTRDHSVHSMLLFYRRYSFTATICYTPMTVKSTFFLSPILYPANLGMPLLDLEMYHIIFLAVHPALEF